MKLQRALTFLDNVKNKAEVVPFRRFASSTGRNAQSEWHPPLSSYDIRQEVVSGRITARVFGRREFGKFWTGYWEPDNE